MNETAFKFADFHTCVLEKIRDCATFFFSLNTWGFGFSFNSPLSVPEHEKGKGRKEEDGMLHRSGFLWFFENKK